MKQGWEIKKLGEVCYYDKVPNKKTELPYVGLEDIESNTGRLTGSLEPRTAKSLTFLFTDNHVLYGRLRPYLNKVLLPDFEGHCSTEIFPIKPTKILDKRYLFHWLISSETVDKINSTWSGATLPRANMNAVLDFNFPLPPLPEQKHIVSILDEAFASIAKAKANAEQNLKNAKELFESYLQSVFVNKIQGTKSESLDTLCELIVDCEHKTAPIQEKGYPSIRTPNIGKGSLILADINRVSEETYSKWTKRAIPRAGDLILAREAPAGNVAVIPENLKVCLGQRTVLIRTKKDRLSPMYLTYLLLSKDVQAKLLSHSRGATVTHINMKDIRAFKIYDLSPLSEQQTLIRNLDALAAETIKLEAIYQQKLNDLEELKKSILQKAFNGEL